MLAITLTTAWDPGSNDPGGPYPKCLMMEYRVNRYRGLIEARTFYGDIVDDVLQQGSGADMERHIIKGADYDAVLAATSAAAAEVYVDELERQILDWISTNVAVCAGTVE